MKTVRTKIKDNLTKHHYLKMEVKDARGLYEDLRDIMAWAEETDVFIPANIYGSIDTALSVVSESFKRL